MNFRNIALAALMMGLIVGNGFGMDKKTKEEKPEKEIKEKEEAKALITTKNFEELKEPLVKSEQIKEQVIYDNRGILWSLFGREIKGFKPFGSKFVQKFGKNNEGHTKAVLSVSITSDGETVVSGSDDKTIKVWRFNKEKGKYELKQILDKNNEGHTKSIRSVSITPDGNTFVSGSEDQNIQVWRFNKEKGTQGEYELKQIFNKNNVGHINIVLSVSITPDGNTFVSGSWDQTIKVWGFNKETGKYEWKQTLDNKHEEDPNIVRSVSITPDGNTFVSGLWNQTIKVWRFNPKKGKQGEYELKQILDKNNGGHTKYVESVSIIPDGNTIVSGSYDGTVKVWRFNKEKGNQGEYELKQTLDKNNGGHTTYVESVSIMPDGNTFVSGAYDETIKIFTCGDDSDFKCDLTINLKSLVMTTFISKNYTVTAGLKNGDINIYRFGDFLKTFEALSFQQLLLVIKLQRDALKGMKKISLQENEERFFFTLPKPIQALFSDVIEDWKALEEKWNKQFDIENFKDLKKKRLELEKKQKEEMLKNEDFNKKMEKRKSEGFMEEVD